LGDALPRSFNEYCTEEGPDRDVVQTLVCDGLCLALGNLDQDLLEVKTSLDETTNERLASKIASVRFANPNTGQDLTAKMQAKPLEGGPLRARLSMAADMVALTPLANLLGRGTSTAAKKRRRRKRAADNGATFVPIVSRRERSSYAL
jgi:hypothetical protein